MLDSIVKGLSKPSHIRGYFPMLIRYSACNTTVRIDRLSDITPNVSFRVVAVNVKTGDYNCDDPRNQLQPLTTVIDAHIRRVLDACRGDRRAAAEILKMHPNAIYRWATTSGYEFDAGRLPT